MPGWAGPPRASGDAQRTRDRATCVRVLRSTTSRCGARRTTRRRRARARLGTRATRRSSSRYRDADGRPPRHSFFFPGEQYGPRYLDALADLARAGLGEVEVHLHHDGDTAADAARRSSTQTLADFAAHGHLVARRRRPPPLRLHPRQLVPRQRARATGAGAASTTRCRCCSTPAATPTSRSRRRPTRASRTS